MKTPCPGLNHSYKPGETYYTLQAESGRFLCHPAHYVAGDAPGSIYCMQGFPPQSKQGHQEGGLTQHLNCAWVTYSMEALREVYTFIAPRFPLSQECPRSPYTGQFRQQSDGQVVMTDGHKMSARELQKFAQSLPKPALETPKNQERTPAIQEKQTKIYAPGRQVELPAFSANPTPHDGEGTRASRKRDTAKERIAAWKKQREAGGVMGYDLPKSPILTPTKKERR